MRKKKKRTGLILIIVTVSLIVCALSWFLSQVFEGEKPQIVLSPLPAFISKPQTFTLHLTDKKRGLRKFTVDVTQGNKKLTISKKSFLFKNIMNRDGCHEFNLKFSLDPEQLHLTQGEASLTISVWDYSMRRGGDGNLSITTHKFIVDTVPPALRVISRMHYISVGGTGLVVYQVSSDTVKSGVYAGDLFFPGFKACKKSKDGFTVCYFTIPYNMKLPVDIHLWAKDRAGNTSTGRFYYHIHRRRVHKSRLNISDRFLNRVLPWFSFYKFPPQLSNIEKFIEINSKLRKENTAFFYSLRTKTSPDQLWDGLAWLRLKNAATMARFGDRRTYYYKGHKIGSAVHLGVDLASLANAEVQAANNGRVLFAGPVGIYGMTVVLDHGQGLASSYSHLSKITVKTGQTVSKGEMIGYTGQTGLAGGDHLHFGVMVNGIFVNPAEWWDPHWVHDNIARKLSLIKK